MQKLQDSVFTLVKTTNLSPAVFSFLQPSDDLSDKTPLGGILKDTKLGWLALGPKFCVVDLKTGMKVASRTFGATLSNNATVTSVVELSTPLTENSQQLVISLQCDDLGIICILNINGSQILRCIQTEVVITQLAVSDSMADGCFTCFDGIVVAGTKQGEIIAFDLNRAALMKALKDISQGYEHLIQNELKPTNLTVLPLDALHRIEEQREIAVENNHHLAVLLNEDSFIKDQFIFRNPDSSVRMKAKLSHIRVTVLEYIPQTGSVAVGFNFGAFQLWNLMTLDLEFTSQVNVECLPVTHFGFQEPCDDPRAFCYLWVVFSVVDRFEEEFPLAVMYSLTYQGKRMISETKCLYQEFSSAAIRFQLELSSVNEAPLLGGKCISCHTYSIKSTLGDDGEDSMLNLCQFVWECWAENTNAPMQYGMLLFDLDQWYKDQMPSTHRVESNAFLSSSFWSDLSGGSGGVALHARLDPATLSAYSHATRLEEHFYPNSLQYNCICLNTSEVCVLSTIGIQRQVISSMDEGGPTVLLSPARLYGACAQCGLTPLLASSYSPHITQEEQRRYLLSVALEARLSRFLKRCAHDWATGSHSGVGCTLPFLVDWCWKRAIELKENAKELTAPLFTSSALPDRNIIRCLEHCVQQLTQLTGLMDAILTKCCNLVVPDALSEMEEKHKGIGTVSLYFQVVQWFLRVGLLPERVDGSEALPYPAMQLYGTYNKRRMKLNRLQENASAEECGPHKSCLLLYIDQLIEQEFDGDRIHQMWVKGGSESGGLYPPPSLYALLRLYLLPDIAEEHKHSLVLYLLVDYSMIYDDVRYETVIRRLMQFPTMFGLSNTAIKATQAFWHLDHRDFDFALDQLQCLTGNTLSEWQHNVVLSSLLAQKKTQAALQYLHVRKPAPIHTNKESEYSINDHDKLEDWHSCCNLYLARGLVYEALDVVRMCVQNVASLTEKTQVLNMFFKGCRNTGNLSKVLAITLLPLEEEVFVRYMENCKESQTSDILIMYYLQQARYLEAKRYNNVLRQSKPKIKEISASMESLFDFDRDGARDALVEVMSSALPSIAETVAHCAFNTKDLEPHVTAPKPMSVFVQAKSPKNTFVYKSSFIQDTIENASETWMNRPKMRQGLKRMLNIEETPFICTPKLTRTRSIFTDVQSESTPPKRARLNLTGTPKTPRSGFKVGDKLRGQMDKLLDMPEMQSPVTRLFDGPDTPHSILKSRGNSRMDAASPTGSRYLESSDDELEMETASNHTHYSDTNSKHLRFTIPTPVEVDATSTPSPTNNAAEFAEAKERERSASTERERDVDMSTDSYVTTASHAINESSPLESPPKKLATEVNVSARKSYKDTVRARSSHSISANSSLSEDPNTSIESIADIPVTLINPRYRRRLSIENKDSTETQDRDVTLAIERQIEKDIILSGETQIEKKSGEDKRDTGLLEVPKTPQGRRGIRGSETPLSRSRSATPERLDSPTITPLRSGIISRSRSKTPELSPRSSPLPSIQEQPIQETESEPRAETSALSVPRILRSRSRTPERLDRGVSESPKLEAIKESPTKTSDTESPPASPSRRSLRSRSRTPEVEVTLEPVLKPSPRSLRSRSKTPEKMSPKKEYSMRNKKSLSRLVLEANTFAKTKATLEKLEAETASESSSEPVSSIECTPMKTTKVPSLMDVTLSPIVNKSVLQSSNDSVSCEEIKEKPFNISLTPLPPFPPLRETFFEKSILHSYQSSVGESSESITEETKTEFRIEKSIPAFTTINEDFGRSVLHSFESSVTEISQNINITKSPLESGVTPENCSVLHSENSIGDSNRMNASSLITDDSDVEMSGSKERAEQKEMKEIVEIEREIHAIEDMSNVDSESSGQDSDDESSVSANASEEASSSELSANDDAISISDSDAEASPQYDTNTDSNQSRESGSYNKDSSSNQSMEVAVSNDSSSPPSKADSTEISKKTLPAFKGIKEIRTDSDNSSGIMSPKHKRNTIESDEDSSSTNQPKITTPGTDSDSSLPAMKQSTFKRIMKNLSDSDSSSAPKSSSKTLERDNSEVSCPSSQSTDFHRAKKLVPYSDSSSSASMSISSKTISDQPKETYQKTKQDDSKIKPHGSSQLENEEVSLLINVSNPFDLAQVSLMTEDNSSIAMETSERKDPLKPTDTKKQDETAEKMDVDPLAQVSLMTEDNTGSDQELNLNYSDETEESPVKPVLDIRVEEIAKPQKPFEETTVLQSVDVVDTAAPETHVETIVIDNKNKQDEETKTTKVKTTKKSAEINTDEENKLVIEEKAVKIRTKESKGTNVEKMDTASELQTLKPVEVAKPTEAIEVANIEKNYIESNPELKSKESAVIEENKTQVSTQTIQQDKIPMHIVEKNVEKVDTDSKPLQTEVTKPTRTRKREKSTSSNTVIEPKETEEPETTATRKRTTKTTKDISETTETEVTKTPTTRKRASSVKRTEVPKATEEPTSKTSEVELPTEELKTPSRKRTTKSDVKTQEVETEIDEAKTPVTRKRSQSITSNKSEETTPENTPSQRKTPSEVRKMITRRMSREMRENQSLDESIRSVEELTPKRRTGRRNTDDNESVASESSVSSVQSTETKSRRGRKSVVATKPDLSVIPEVLAEESREQSALDAIQEYSGTRKLTRHQRSVLETSRRRSNASRVSRSSVSEQEEDRPAFDLQPIDRISLLNKESYEGPPDEDELRLNMSPESMASDASKMRRSRMTRAASEAKVVVKAAKIHRRIASTDVPLGESPMGSPSALDSPARGRRASFTRAIEALHTPKGRRTSVDSKKSDVGSPTPESPVPSDADAEGAGAAATPTRRRRRASAHSNTSQAGRTRSKKMPVLEEVTETKK